MFSEKWISSVLSIAEEAAEAVMKIYQRKTYQINAKLDNSPVTEADLCSHQIILQGLSCLTPEVPVLSEEGAGVPFEIRTAWSRFWLIDPLDGTQEFIQGTGEFTINIALIENHRPVFGIVMVPALQQCYWGTSTGQAYWQVKGQDILSIKTCSSRMPLKVVVSKRNKNLQPGWVAFIKQLQEYELNYCGSALKICLVAKGEADLYPQLGETYEWDTAAGQCILVAAGGQLMDSNGQMLCYNTRHSLKNPKFYAMAGQHLSAYCCG